MFLKNVRPKKILINNNICIPKMRINSPLTPNQSAIHKSYQHINFTCTIKKKNNKNIFEIRAYND